MREGFGAIRDVILDNTQDNLVQEYRNIDTPNRLRQAQNEFLKSSEKSINSEGIISIIFFRF